MLRMSKTDRQNDCSSYGADVGPFGMSRCIGLRPGGGLDLGDWEISMQERGVGVWLGRQQQIDQWSPSWLQWK